MLLVYDLEILHVDMPSVVEVSQPVAVATAPQPVKQYVPQIMQIAPMEKTNYHGIEVINEIVWQGWEPGREYTKNIILKNVNVKTQKIKYRYICDIFFIFKKITAVILIPFLYHEDVFLMYYI